MLPHLLYIGDVPVESTFHGSALMYRMLENYCADKLTIVETASTSEPSRRLPEVTYLSHALNSSWLNTRFHPYVAAWLSVKAAGTQQNIMKVVGDAAFQGVLTVAHGFGWLAAARVAEQWNVPLHLIIHDDWPRVAHVPLGFRSWLDRRFAAVYNQASSRLCVSPSMRDAYTNRYGRTAEVLYPLRAANCPEYLSPPERLSNNPQPFTVAFAGTINSEGYVKALAALSEALVGVRGRLLVFGPTTHAEARHLNLDLANVSFCGLLQWPDLIARLRSNVDLLFVPMSFSEADSLNMQLAFPSKLADYTAVGLPLLIYGPPYCSAVRWAQENPGAAEVVHDEGAGSLTEVIHHLANAPAHRLLLAQRALEVGRRYFSHAAMQSLFCRAIARKTATATETVSVTAAATA